MTSHQHARQVLFALLSNTERDLRQLLVDQFNATEDLSAFLSPELYNRVIERLEKDNGKSSSELGLIDIIEYLDWGDLPALLNRHRQFLSTDKQPLVSQHMSHVQDLTPVRNRVMHHRTLEFDDLPLVKQFCEDLLEEYSDSFPNLQSTIALLRADPNYASTIEIEFAQDDFQCTNNLPVPDYLDTGFIGRQRTVEDLRRAIDGPYPVVSILGEGGLGKTALALKLAYDIVCSPNCPYDAVIFASAKSATLSTDEIRRIDDAIGSSLGLLARATHQLGGNATSTNPTTELLEYLKQFRILLILDNVETVIDTHLQDFLQQLPNGSKVLVTSRVGMNAYEFPIRLKPMDTADSVLLFRQLCKVKGIEYIQKASNEQIAKRCNSLFYNPLAITWFLGAVQLGNRPEDVLSDKTVLLEYCCSNVYKFLDSHSKQAISVLQVMGSPLSASHLAVLSEADPIQTRRALHQLESVNLISKSVNIKGELYSTLYQLDGLAKHFLSKTHPVDEPTRLRISAARKRLTSQLEAIQSYSADPYDINTICTISDEHKVAATKLWRALQHCRPKQLDLNRALIEVEHAKSMTPDYFEVSRVEAFVRQKRNEIGPAMECYLLAVDMKPDHAPLRFWFAQFLLHDGDAEGAAKHLEIARKLDPESNILLVESARTELFRHRFDSCRKLVTGCLSDIRMPEQQLRIAWDIYIQSYSREADIENSRGNKKACLSAMQGLQAAFESVPSYLRDNKMKSRLEKVKRVTASLIFAFTEGEEKSIANSIHQWMVEVVGNHEDIKIGTIKALKEEFGFITEDSGGDLYFSLQHVHCEPSLLRVGSRVTYSVGRNTRGNAAIGVELV